MTIGRMTTTWGRTLMAVLMVSSTAWVAGAQTHDDHMSAAASQQARKPNPQENELVQAVRDATAKYRNVNYATGQGYALTFGCVSGGDYGAMGLHFVKGPLLGDGEIDIDNPEIVLYEALPGGRVRITGADYLVYAADWDARHDGPPALMGQLFHLFESPNRFGLPAFYTLHVWAWKDNPNGTFTNWNPAVSCDDYNPRTALVNQ
jgi:hypothetical protein